MEQLCVSSLRSRGHLSFLYLTPLFSSQICICLTQAKLKPRKIASQSSILTGTLRKWESAVWIRSFQIFSDEHLLLGCSLRRLWSRWVSFWPKAGAPEEAHSWQTLAKVVLKWFFKSTWVILILTSLKKQKTKKKLVSWKNFKIFTLMGEIIEIIQLFHFICLV